MQYNPSGDKTNPSQFIGVKIFKRKLFVFLLSLHIAFRIASHPFLFLFNGVQEIDAINIWSGGGNKPSPLLCFQNPQKRRGYQQERKDQCDPFGSFQR